MSVDGPRDIGEYTSAVSMSQLSFLIASAGINDQLPHQMPPLQKMGLYGPNRPRPLEMPNPKL